MSEAPKKIWIGETHGYWMTHPCFDSDTPYIRADIVEEMREALAGLVEYVGRDHAGVGLAELHGKGIYALKRLEGA